MTIPIRFSTHFPCPGDGLIRVPCKSSRQTDADSIFADIVTQAAVCASVNMHRVGTRQGECINHVTNLQWKSSEKTRLRLAARCSPSSQERRLRWHMRYRERSLAYSGQGNGGFFLERFLHLPSPHCSAMTGPAEAYHWLTGAMALETSVSAGADAVNAEEGGCKNTDDDHY